MLQDMEVSGGKSSGEALQLVLETREYVVGMSFFSSVKCRKLWRRYTLVKSFTDYMRSLIPVLSFWVFAGLGQSDTVKLVLLTEQLRLVSNKIDGKQAVESEEADHLEDPGQQRVSIQRAEPGKIWHLAVFVYQSASHRSS